MHSAGLELTKLTYTRLEDNLIRHRGDRLRHGALQTYDTKHIITANVYPEIVYMLVSVALDYQGLADYNTLLKLDLWTFPVSI